MRRVLGPSRAEINRDAEEATLRTVIASRSDGNRGARSGARAEGLSATEGQRYAPSLVWRKATTLAREDTLRYSDSAILIL